MNNDRLDQALSALGFALKSYQEENPLANPQVFIDKIPQRALSGNLITGGKITNFSSNGIRDEANSTQLTVKEGVVKTKNLSIESIVTSFTVHGDVSLENLNAKTVTADVLDVKEIKTEIKLEKNTPIIWSGDNIYSKGLIWSGQGVAKQLVLTLNPDRIFSSEIIDVAKDKYFSINNEKVLDGKELGPGVVKSNLREVGRLKGLAVDGSVIINQYFFYDSHSDRIGLGTDEPKAALDIVDNGVEILISGDGTKASIGTFASHDFDIKTNNTSRFTVKSNGDLFLGNSSEPPINVTINGKLSVGITNPDPNVDIHVRGAIRFKDKVHTYGSSPPQGGFYNVGDIVWNDKPEQKKYVGWVCTKTGNPGIWNPFGEIR